MIRFTKALVAAAALLVLPTVASAISITIVESNESGAIDGVLRLEERLTARLHLVPVDSQHLHPAHGGVHQGPGEPLAAKVLLVGRDAVSSLSRFDLRKVELIDRCGRWVQVSIDGHQQRARNRPSCVALRCTAPRRAAWLRAAPRY